MEFLKHYIKSMRLYYGFVTLTCGWAGVAAYQFNHYVNIFDKITVLTIMFVGWGINQIINDYMGLKEDKINAPERPMVSGKLKPIPALSLSLFVILIAVGWSLFKNPLSLIPLLCGVLMNIVYSYAKGYGILGNITFGLSISSCMVYSYAVLGGSLHTFFIDKVTLIPFLFIVFLNMIMTYYTYFKDYEGDKQAEKNTLVVQLGLKRASFLGLFLSVIPFLMFSFAGSYNLPFIGNINKPMFVTSYIIASLLFVFTGFLYYRKNTGDNTYFNLKYNFAALSACQAAVVSFYCILGNISFDYTFIYYYEGLILTIVSALSVILIFKLGYKNAKA